MDHEKGDVMNTKYKQNRNGGYRSTNPEDQVRNKMEELQYRVQVAETII